MRMDICIVLVFFSLCCLHLAKVVVARDPSLLSLNRGSATYTSSQDTNNRHMWDNGALPVVLNALSEQIIEEMQRENPVDRLSETQAKLLASKLKGLYAHLKDHPALMERRLYVGSYKPDILPNQRLKRTFHDDIAQPVCPERTEWRLLRRAKDINDTEVEVFQPELGSNQIKQWFYTVNCDNNAFRHKRDCPGCCMGIDHNRYNSGCRQKKTYVMALIRRLHERVLDWNWIQVNTGCTCAISQKFDVMFPL